MSKRTAEDQETLESLKAGQRPDAGTNGDTTLDFEDEFEDEYESEDEIMEAGVDGRPDVEREAEQAQDAMDVDSNNQTFIPGRSILQPGMSLTPDPSTYEMLHMMSTNWPCLSFDFVRDNLGDNRKQYPRALYAVAGTQAESSRAKENELYVLRLSSLSKMDRGNQTDSESDSDDDEDDEGSTDPVLESRSIPLPSTTNRIRAFQPASAASDPTQISQTLTATWLENGQVLIHDVSPYLHALSTPGSTVPPNASKPLSTLRMHKAEGYALDWAPASSHPNGRLLTGDNAGQIFSTQRTEGGGWVTDTRPFVGHTDAVEELQWSPNEKFVFASASSDGTVKVWDARSKSRKPMIDVKISNTDVNVMSWSTQTFHLLATGADDGEWAVWDLRQWKPQSGAAPGAQLKPSPVADFHFHKKPITSIEWHPSDDSVVAVACADNTATLWDLAVELDDEEYGKEAGLGLGEGPEKVPPQLLFIHHVEDGKELHWHPQMPGTVMVTGGSGLGVFKTISV
jgi:ribosome assembly protein RRB1